jgi:hypothetical protein
MWIDPSTAISLSYEDLRCREGWPVLKHTSKSQRQPTLPAHAVVKQYSEITRHERRTMMFALQRESYCCSTLLHRKLKQSTGYSYCDPR